MFLTSCSKGIKERLFRQAGHCIYGELNGGADKVCVCMCERGGGGGPKAVSFGRLN
jgi:hypothetical protein